MKHDPARWVADYKRNGYVVVEDCLSPDLIGKLSAALDTITDAPDSLPDHLKRHIDFERNYVKHHPQNNEFSSEEVGVAIRNIMELPAFDPIFAHLICYPPQLDILQALFGTTEFAFHNYKCIIKAPRISSRFVWHRDLPYLQHTSPNLITCMLCVDDMTEENGATVVMPGTHRIPHEEVKESDMDIPESELPSSPKVTVCCPAGSAVLFHESLIHGGGANRSETPRRNIISIWSGPNTYPTYAHRLLYQGLMPRSEDPHRQRQVAMTFPNLAEVKETEWTLS